MNALRAPNLGIRIIVHAVVWAAALSMAAPLVWMVLTSLKTDAETTAPITWRTLLPRSPVWGNYARAWREAGLGDVLGNTLIVAGVTTLLAVAHNALAAYAFTKLRFRGKRILLGLTIATMLAPIQVYFLVMAVICEWAGLIDTLSGLIIPFAASGFGILYIRQAIERMPRSLFEAGRIDGMDELEIFWSVVRPAIHPALWALAIISFVNAWNAFFWPLVAIDSEEKKTLPLAIADLNAGVYVQSWPVQMAAAAILVAPLVVMFLAAQRAFIRGLTAGAEKD